jgi:dipeptidyl aminopeptidase/acylaminoacyl peptidase
MDSYHYLDLYMPDGECTALFLFFHGGGFIEGSRKDITTEHPFVKDMIEAGFGVASAEYRMYPDARYPDFIEDAASAVAFVKGGLMEYGGYGKLIVGGCSAGAYMTQMLCFNGAFLKAVGVSNDDITAYVHDAGQPTVHFNVLRERGYDHRRIIVDKEAPLYYVGLEKSYPPMEIIVSDNDIENRYEQTKMLLGTLRHFGYDMSKVHLKNTSGEHVWYVNATDENGESECANLIIPFINSII